MKVIKIEKCGECPHAQATGPSTYACSNVYAWPEVTLRHEPPEFCTLDDAEDDAPGIDDPACELCGQPVSEEGYHCDACTSEAIRLEEENA